MENILICLDLKFYHIAAIQCVTNRVILLVRFIFNNKLDVKYSKSLVCTKTCQRERIAKWAKSCDEQFNLDAKDPFLYFTNCQKIIQKNRELL
jgi:hypothetical protein